jgi:preprotein translocase subunit Sec63
VLNYALCVSWQVTKASNSVTLRNGVLNVEVNSRFCLQQCGNKLINSSCHIVLEIPDPIK